MCVPNALTDRDGTYGAVKFVRAARSAGIRPVLGVDTPDEALAVTLDTLGAVELANIAGLLGTDDPRWAGAGVAVKRSARPPSTSSAAPVRSRSPRPT